MTRQEEVERAARAIHENYCACLALSGRDANERRCDLGRALSRRDDEKAVAWPTVDEVRERIERSMSASYGCGLSLTVARTLAAQDALDFIKERVVVTRPECHDAGAGKCGTCGGENRRLPKFIGGGPIKTVVAQMDEFYARQCKDPFHNATGEAKS